MSRRALLKSSSVALATSLLPNTIDAAVSELPQEETHLNLNENAWGPSPRVAGALQRELPRLSRYADATLVQPFLEQIAAYERVSVEQIIPGEILTALGLWLGTQGGPGGEFIYSVPGYTALVDAAARVGGVGVPVPLNNRLENDLSGLRAKLSPKTRAVYLINPHNPSGTVSSDREFRQFLDAASAQAPVIVDEAYLEYTSDFKTRSAVSAVRDGSNVLVFRTFDKIYGLAGLPMGYAIAPRKLASALRSQGIGDFESLGRLNTVVASAALVDQAHVAHVRSAVAAERAKWIEILDELRLPHTNAQASFIFFDAGERHGKIISTFTAHKVEVGRPFAPRGNWIRITIGLPKENTVVQRLLRKSVAS